MTRLRRPYFSLRSQSDRFLHFWYGGGNLSSGYTDKIEVVPISTFSPFDSGIDLGYTETYGSEAPGPSRIYHKEGYNNSSDTTDVGRIDIATYTFTEAAFAREDGTYFVGMTSTRWLVWMIGGRDTGGTRYDDADHASFATETSVNIESQLFTGITAMGCYATLEKFIHAGGYTGVTDDSIQGWPHSTNTVADIADLPSPAGSKQTASLSDVALYATVLSTNERMVLATETTSSVNTPPNSSADDIWGNGTFGTGGVRAGGDTGSKQDGVYAMSFATETWVDTTGDLTEAKSNGAMCAG